ncbi:MAG: peptide synthase [Desulfobulbaceae bacterium]|nr:MAG: peptide synthase [Desulfobulbaceae bacterium]
MNFNIAQTLADVASRRPDEIALIQGRAGHYSRCTFAELRACTARYVSALRGQGIGPDRRVMLMVPPSRDFVALTFALFSLGATVILIDPGMGYKNLLRCIGAVKPDVLIGIPKAQIFKLLFPRPFKSITGRVCVGKSLGILGASLAEISRSVAPDPAVFAAGRDDQAAIIFTTGSTGPPKGVQYTHGIFHAQLELIRSHYQIGPGQVDQPAFPLFALFSTALGATAVLPDMDPAKPARVDAEKFVRSLLDQGVTYSFGSPAIWNVVSRYCLDKGIVLPVKKILMAGAPVAGELIERVLATMAAGGEVHTPYGATECLPIASMTGSEIVGQTWPLTMTGKGTCVGRPLPGLSIRIMQAADRPVERYHQVVILPPGEIGEIIVKGPVVTRAYDNNPQENKAAKIRDGDSFWHRMGDMGYFDEQGRLWFCGRKAHRVLTRNGPLYTIPCEAIYNVHAKVYRTALVGVGRPGKQIPVLCVECVDKRCDTERLALELRALGVQNKMTKGIDHILFYPKFPVDIRHNAKIFREKLAVWAAKKLAKER